MESVELGNSGLLVSVLGLGCAPLGGGGGWGEATLNQASSTVHAALDLGINFFDTAESYNSGRSEELLGYALFGRRDKAVIATKISPQNTEPNVIRDHCEGSLKRLKTDYIDLYQIHWPIVDRDTEQIFLTLRSLQEEGKIRAIGVSNFGVRQLQQITDQVKVVSNQVCYNLVSRAVEFDILPFCSGNNIAVITYMPLMQGLLAGLYKNYFDMPKQRATTRHFDSTRPYTMHDEPGAEEELFKALAEIERISENAGLSTSDVALAWVLANSVVSSILIGSRKPNQLKRNVRALQVKLASKDIAKLNEVTLSLKLKMGKSADYWYSGDRARTM